MCIVPTFVQNRKYLPNKKNKGRPPLCDDPRKRFVPVGCGVCSECRRQKANGWRIRIIEELKTNPNAEFITLTLSNENIDKLENKLKSEGIDINKIDANMVATKAVRYFLERIRKETKKSKKHFLITELGHVKTERVHLHGIIWDLQDYIQTDAFGNKKSEWLKDKWKFGNIYIGKYCNEKSANYIIKYITKTDTDHSDFISKILVSPGMGKGYLNREDKKKTITKE